jgi:hypothetical protein
VRTHIVARLSVYSKRRAEDEESQLTKKNLSDLGELLQSHSDAIINKANEVIASPRDPAVKKAFADEVRASMEITHQLVTPLRENEGAQPIWVDDEEILEASDNLICKLIASLLLLIFLGTIPKIVDVSLQLTASPSDEKLKENMAALMENVKVESRTIAATAVPTEELTVTKEMINRFVAQLSVGDGKEFDPNNILGTATDLAGIVFRECFSVIYGDFRLHCSIKWFSKIGNSEKKIR